MARRSVDDDGDSRSDMVSAERESGTGSGVAAVCRYLLIPGSGVRYGRPERDHRCVAVRPHDSPAQDKQRRLCLTSDHATCPAFLAARQRRLAMLADSGISASAMETGRLRPLTRSAPLVLEDGHAPLGRGRGPGARDAAGAPVPARHPAAGIAGDRHDAASARAGSRTPSRGWRSLAGPGAALLVVVAALAVLAARLPGAAPAAADASPSPSTAVTGSAAATPAATTAATPAVSVAASPTPPPTAAVTLAPTATPTTAPTTTYRVKAGDTLSGIAARYGVTVADLQQLNDIKDPRFLQIGQVLKIP